MCVETISGERMHLFDFFQLVHLLEIYYFNKEENESS